MKIKYKIIGISLIALVISIATYIYYSNRFSYQIEKIISENLPENIELNYGELNANIITNSFEINKLKIKVLDQGLSLNVEQAYIDGIDFATILVSDKISIGEIELIGADLFVDPSNKKEITTNIEKKDSREITVDKFIAQFKTINTKDSIGEVVFYTKSASIDIDKIFIKPLKNKKRPKITYNIQELKSDSTYISFSKQQIFTAKSFDINAKKANFQNALVLVKNEGLEVNLKEIGIHGAPFNHIFNKDSIVIDSILLSEADILVDESKKTNNSKNEKNSNKNIDKTLIVKSLKLKSSHFQKNNEYKNKTLCIDSAYATFQDIKFSSKKENQEKFQYKFISFRAENFDQQTNFLHQFKIANIDIDSGTIKLSNLSLNPLYEKVEFQKHIKKEQDVIHLKIPEITVTNFDYSFKNSADNFFRAAETTVFSPDVNIYRSKVPPEPTTRKPLYSEMLRKLEFGLKLDEIRIDNGRVVYEEHHDNAQPPGKLIFDKLNAKILDLNNIEAGKSVSIVVDTKFMETAPTHIQWNFNISQPYDKFRIWGTIKNLPAEKVNIFFENNLNVKAKGYVNNTRFDFTGNDISASGVLNMDYDEFEVELLKKDSKEKKGLLSAVANWFVNDDEKKKNQNETISVERDQTKSFFNYFWLCIREGLKQHVLKF